MAENLVPALKNAVLGLMLIMECNRFHIDPHLRAQLLNEKRPVFDDQVVEFNLSQVLGYEPFTEPCNPIRHQLLSITYFELERNRSLEIPSPLEIMREQKARLLIIRVVPHEECDLIKATYGDKIGAIDNIVRMFVCQLDRRPSDSNGEAHWARVGLFSSLNSTNIEFAETIREGYEDASLSSTKPVSGARLRGIWSTAEDLKMELAKATALSWHSFCHLGCNEEFRMRHMERVWALRITVAWFLLLVVGVSLILFCSHEKSEESLDEKQGRVEAIASINGRI